MAVRVLDALRNQKKYGEGIVKELINYVPDRGKVEVNEDDTGSFGTQYFETEDLLWHLSLYVNIHTYEEKACLIGSETQAKLILGGYISYTLGMYTMNQIAKKCYSNEALGLNAVSIRKEEWEWLPEEQKKGVYWLANRYGDIASEKDDHGLYCARFSELVKCSIYSHKALTSNGYRLSIRPMIYLPEDAMIDLDSRTDERLNLILPKKK